VTWFKVDDTLALHAKVVAAGNAAMGLWVRAGSWSAQQLSEGFVPDHIAKMLGSRAEIQRLVEARLWTREDGGYQFWQWADDGRQPSRQQVEADRAANRARQKRARERAKSRRDEGVLTDVSNGVSNGERNGVTNAAVTASVTVPPTRPVSTETSLRSVSGPDEQPSAAGLIVKAYVDGAAEAGMDKPTSELCSKVGRDARRLLTKDHIPVDRLTEAARRMGASGWDSLARELQRMSAEKAKRRPRAMADVREVEAGWSV
jgi:hypothetical protein